MATRPIIAVTVRATDTNYSGIGNDLDTTPTKIERSGAELALGYVPDSPLGTRPVSAQGINYDQNRNDQWIKWVTEGSDAAGGNTHIVETDSGGDINIVGVNCADVRVTPNPGTDGVEVTTTLGSKGVEVLQDATSTDFGMSVDSVDGATGAAAFLKTRSSIALGIQGGNAPGINVDMLSNGGAIGPSIKLEANTLEPSDNTSGTLWNKTISGAHNLKAGIGATGISGFVLLSKNAACYAKSVTKVDFLLTGSPTNQEIAPIFTWSPQMLPQAADQVRVTIWGRVAISNNQTNLVSLKVRDRTEVVDPIICEITLENDDTGGANFLQTSATFSQIYTLPLLGTRNFDLVWSGNIGGAQSGLFNGFVEIEQLRG